ncbi:ABC transporter ATP-binding protein [Tengunoibacter tsumagoiensis]|uniref:ABC-type quaternary amine transporter n=1 Tax=Tengunoibacter tsumagoiensis TaxID=2014871 RepID=A0A401ZW12_9CHLR|nr:ABC transporter ATP-binding protein [Tengunoibacter tsumagoiensis]GCE11093.1 ABC transporter ATP-binding protein [Tengunoibacter tsumagoiensis]
MLEVMLDTRLKSFHLAVDFSVREGETLVLLGESGAGKSTVLRALVGLLQPEQGRIVYNGRIYLDSQRRVYVPPQERPFGYVFQEYVLFPHLTVFENVAFGLRAQHIPQVEIRRRVREALEQVHLSNYETRRPGQLSGGQQQRVAIARALVLQPQLLLLDEPLAALDVQTRREVRQELRQILQQAHITTVMVTHQYIEALLFGQQILVLEQGRILQQGDQQKLRESPRSSYVAELVGVNLFMGRLLSYEGSTLCRVQLAGMQSLEIIATLREGVQRLHPGAEMSIVMYIVIDPRSITLYRQAPESSARNIFAGEIVQLLHLGGGSLENGSVRVGLALEQSKIPLTAEITEASAQRLGLQEGQRIYATFKATEASAYV